MQPGYPRHLAPLGGNFWAGRPSVLLRCGSSAPSPGGGGGGEWEWGLALVLIPPCALQYWQPHWQHRGLSLGPEGSAQVGLIRAALKRRALVEQWEREAVPSGSGWGGGSRGGAAAATPWVQYALAKVPFHVCAGEERALQRFLAKALEEHHCRTMKMLGLPPRGAE